MDIITKTLYIQIDETPMPEMPELLAKMVPTVDCRLMNDFYSNFGDALCGDLTTPDGHKLYRIITPAGCILSEYAEADGSAEAMADLRKQWYDLLVTILDGTCAPTFTFSLPTHFLKWLEHHPTNDYYPLLASRAQITLSTAEIAPDIRSSAEKIITQALEKEYTTCVFSNPKFYPSDTVCHRASHITSYNKWQIQIQLLKNETLKKINSPIAPDDISLDGCVLGKADWLMFAWLGADEGSSPDSHKKFEYLNYKGTQIWFKDGIWEHTYVTREDSYPFGKFLTQITNGPTNCQELNFFQLTSGNYELHNFYNFWDPCPKPVFRCTKIPTFSDGWFHAEMEKQTERYLITLGFLKKCSSLSAGMITPGTLYSISIKSKNN